jgi:hypothetical protein
MRILRKLKVKAENVFDEISGTMGISGAADTNIVLERNKCIGKLFVQGRDVEDQTYEMIYDKLLYVWQVDRRLEDDELRLTPLSLKCVTVIPDSLYD